MGWYGTCSTIQEVYNELLTKRNFASGVKLLDHRKTQYGRHLWILLQLPDNQKIIGFYFIQKRSDGWWYKPMDETMHPYYWDCPVSLIQAAGETKNKVALQWRGEVMLRAGRE